jgi:hypothetical protein
MAEENINGVMEIIMKEDFGKAKNKDREYYVTLMEEGMKDTGNMIKNKEKEFYFKIRKLSK